MQLMQKELITLYLFLKSKGDAAVANYTFNPADNSIRYMSDAKTKTMAATTLDPNWTAAPAAAPANGGDGDGSDSDDDQKSDLTTAKEGERGVRTSKQECNTKTVGTGCAETLCCITLASVDMTANEGYKKLDEAGKKTAEEKVTKSLEAMKTANKGTCYAEATTELDGKEFDKDQAGIKYTVACGASAIATSAMAVIAAFATM